MFHYHVRHFNSNSHASKQQSRSQKAPLFDLQNKTDRTAHLTTDAVISLPKGSVPQIKGFFFNLSNYKCSFTSFTWVNEVRENLRVHFGILWHPFARGHIQGHFYPTVIGLHFTSIFQPLNTVLLLYMSDNRTKTSIYCRYFECNMHSWGKKMTHHPLELWSILAIWTGGFLKVTWAHS